MALVSARDADPFAQAQMAAAAYLARYSGRTPRDLPLRPAHVLPGVAERHGGAGTGRFDHRPAAVDHLWVLPLRPHRRPDPVEPRAYARRPTVYPSEGRGLDRGELGRFLFTAERYDPDHAALAAWLVLNGLRVSEACATDAEDLGFDRPSYVAAHRERQSWRQP